jgi:hypothetical protein
MGRTPKFNINYFKDINPRKAYWAGFIAADGCIVKNGTSLQLGLNEKDSHHLITFMKDLSCNKELTHYTTKDGYKTVVTSFTNKDFCIDLLSKFNITPRKSMSYKFPSLSKELQLPLIAGYIDGDGGLYRDNRDDSLCFNVLGTLNVVESIRSILQPEVTSNIHKHTKSDCYYYRHQGRRAEEIKEKILSIKGLPLLERKWSI